MKLTISKILEEVKDKKVIVIGDIIEDVSIFGKTIRACEEGVSNIFDITSIQTSLGGAGLVAETLSVLLSKVILIGAVDFGNRQVKSTFLNGDNLKKERFDGFSDILSAFKGKNIGLIPILKNNWYNQKIRFYSEDGKLIFRTDMAGDVNKNTLSTDDGTTRELEDDILYQRFLHEIDPINKEVFFVILSDYNKGVLNKRSITDIINYCKVHDIPVYVDTKKEDISYFSGAKAVKINNKRFNDGIVVKKLSTNLIVTRGNKEIYLYDMTKNNVINIAEERPYTIPINQEPNFKDAIGAGDIFTAYLSIFDSYFGGKSFNDLTTAIKFSSTVASLSTRFQGTHIFEKKVLINLI